MYYGAITVEKQRIFNYYRNYEISETLLFEEKNMKKDSILKAILIAVSLLAISNAAFAMRLDPQNGTVVSPSAAEPAEESYCIDTDGTTLVWIDSRIPDGTDNEASIYGAAISGTGLGTEFLIDSSENFAENVKVAGKWVAYLTYDEYSYVCIRLIDITDPASPFAYTVDVGNSYARSFGLTEDTLIFTNYTYDGNASTYNIYAADLTALDGTTNYIGLKELILIYSANANMDIQDINLHGTTAVWSGYDQNNWNYYASMCDITGYNLPGFTPVTGQIPYHGEGLYNMELDDNRIVFTSWFSMEGVFGMYDYTVPATAEFKPVMLSSSYDTYLTGAIDLGTANVFALYQNHDYNTNEQSITMKGSTLASNNNSVVSTLRELSFDPAYESLSPITDITTVPDGDVVYWTEFNFTTEKYEIRRADIILECGDWGYNAADLSRDCQVNLIDFSMFAQQWLDCTDPIGSECQFGTVYDNLMAMPEMEHYQY